MGEPMKVTEIFGEDVFNDTVMQERLPKKCIRFKETIEEGKRAGSCDCRRHCT